MLIRRTERQTRRSNLAATVGNQAAGGLDRRSFLKSAGTALAAALVGRRAAKGTVAGDLPPVRQITQGPKHHWFAYYDKLQFDPTNRYLLSMQVDFEHRSPKADDVIQIGMIDLKDNDKWIELDKSSAWGWHS